MPDRLISADALLKEAMQEGAYGYVDAEQIKNAPTVDAEPVRHGHWTEKRNPMMYQLIPYVWVCDQCGTAFYYKTPYCGECKAKMDEVEDAEIN